MLNALSGHSDRLATAQLVNLIGRNKPLPRVRLFYFWSATHLLNSRHQQLGILQESFPAAPESLRLKRAALVAEMVTKNRDRNQCANSQNRLSKSGGRSSHTQITYSLEMAWQAKSGWAEHHRCC